VKLAYQRPANTKARRKLFAFAARMKVELDELATDLDSLIVAYNANTEAYNKAA